MRKDLLKQIDNIMKASAKHINPFLVFVERDPKGGWIASERFSGGKTKEIHIDSLDDLNERYKNMDAIVMMDDIPDDPVIYAADEMAMKEIYHGISYDELVRIAEQELNEQETMRVLTESARKVER